VAALGQSNCKVTKTRLHTAKGTLEWRERRVIKVPKVNQTNPHETDPILQKYKRGNRKYLIARARLAFVYVVSKESESISTFCLTMAFTGLVHDQRVDLFHALKEVPGCTVPRAGRNEGTSN
jgi:hypothetical protein